MLIFNNKKQQNNKKTNSIGFKAKKSLGKKDGVELVNHILKRIGIWFLIAFLPFLLIIIIVVVILSVILWFIPKSSAANNISYFFTNTLQLSIGSSFWTWVVNAIMAVLYLIFIRPIVWVNDSLQTVVLFLGGGALSNRFFTKNVNELFWLIFAVAAIILIIALSLKAIEWMQNRNMQSVKNTAKNSLLVFIGILIIPITFFLINLIMVSIAKVFIDNIGQSSNLSINIFNSSFMNGTHHFDYVPDSWTFSDSGNFSYFICLVAECFLAYILLLITIQLFFKIFELFILYVLAPWVLISAITDEGRKFQNWKDLTLNRFFGFSFIYLAFNIFISSIVIIADVATLIPNSIAQPIFMIVAILAVGLTVAKFPQLLGSIIGGKTSLSDGIGNLMGLGMATAGLSTGIRAGYKAIGKGAKVGHKGIGVTRGIHTATKNGASIWAATAGATIGGTISKFSNSHSKIHSKTLSNIDSLLNIKKSGTESTLQKDFTNANFEKSEADILTRWNWLNLSEKDTAEAKKWYQEKLNQGKGYAGNTPDEFIDIMTKKVKDQNSKEKNKNGK